MTGYYDLFWYLVRLEHPLEVPANEYFWARKALGDFRIEQLVVAPIAFKSDHYKTPRDAIGEAVLQGRSLLVNVSICLDDSRPLPVLNVRNMGDQRLVRERFPSLCGGELLGA
jgi:hypothetical protein